MARRSLAGWAHDRGAHAGRGPGPIDSRIPDLTAIPGFSDPISSISHLLGAGAMAVLAFPLIRKARRAPLQRRVPRISTIVIFVASAILLLGMSGVFHLLEPGTPGREVLKRLDHAAIFVLIAGTFTPIKGILFKGPWRWGMLAFMWAIAATGVVLESIYLEETPEALATLLYIAMGWAVLPSLIALARRYGVRFILPVIYGGVAYTAGALVDLINPPPLIPGVLRSHEVFHIAILMGLGFHTYFIWRIADAPASPAPREWGASLRGAS